MFTTKGRRNPKTGDVTEYLIAVHGEAELNKNCVVLAHLEGNRDNKEIRIVADVITEVG
jgi:translation initiation factor IF-1